MSEHDKTTLRNQCASSIRTPDSRTGLDKKSRPSIIHTSYFRSHSSRYPIALRPASFRNVCPVCWVDPAVAYTSRKEGKRIGKNEKSNALLGYPRHTFQFCRSWPCDSGVGGNLLSTISDRCSRVSYRLRALRTQRLISPSIDGLRCRVPQPRLVGCFFLLLR
jgi:hypothetical protein